MAAEPGKGPAAPERRALRSKVAGRRPTTMPPCERPAGSAMERPKPVASSDGSGPVNRCVFIHTNDRQMVGALVSQHSMRRNSEPTTSSRSADPTKDYPFLTAREGQLYRRGGIKRGMADRRSAVVHAAALHAARADGLPGPGDRDRPRRVRGRRHLRAPEPRDAGKALMCRRAQRGRRNLSSAVMLLDCAQLRHWRTAEQFDELFAFKRDYMDWISLKLEPEGTIGRSSPSGTTSTSSASRPSCCTTPNAGTSPGRRGCRSTSRPGQDPELRAARLVPPHPRGAARPHALLGAYKPHRDPDQERFFFGLLRECVEQGVSRRPCCARRWPATTSATTPSRSWNGPRRSPPEPGPAPAHEQIAPGARSTG